jgi:hypothetical protein
VLVCALARRGLSTAAVLLLAVWVHPTNVFLLPIAVAPFAVREPLAPAGTPAAPASAPAPRDARPRHDRRRRIALLGGAGLALVALGYVLVSCGAPTVLERALSPRVFDLASDRLLDGRQAGEFVARFADLLSGVTVYEYFTGVMSSAARAWHRVLFWLVFAPVVALGGARIVLRGTGRERAFVLGYLAMVALFYLFAGPGALRPHTERYAACLPVPTCLLVALCGHALASRVGAEAALRPAAVALAAALAIAFPVFYFAPLARQPMRAPEAYRTAATEPKQAALAVIAARRDPARATVVLADSWWSYWPLRYRVGPRQGYYLTILGQAHDQRFPSDYRLPLLPAERSQVFAVAFFGEWLDWQLRDRPDVRDRIDIPAGADPPILRVYVLRE